MERRLEWLDATRSIAVVMVVIALTYYLIEKPAITLGRRLTLTRTVTPPIELGEPV